MGIFRAKKIIAKEPSFKELFDIINWADDEIVLKVVQSQSPVAEQVRAGKLTFKNKLAALTGVSRWVRTEDEYGDETEIAGEWVWASEDSYPFSMGYREDAPVSVVLEKLKELTAPN